eukprot:5192999-Amphidinium_carterae.3
MYTSTTCHQDLETGCMAVALPYASRYLTQPYVSRNVEEPSVPCMPTHTHVNCFEVTSKLKQETPSNPTATPTCGCDNSNMKAQVIAWRRWQ